jgi:hypothetical protein
MCAADAVNALDRVGHVAQGDMCDDRAGGETAPSPYPLPDGGRGRLSGGSPLHRAPFVRFADTSPVNGGRLRSPSPVNTGEDHSAIIGRRSGRCGSA